MRRRRLAGSGGGRRECRRGSVGGSGGSIPHTPLPPPTQTDATPLQIQKQVSLAKITSVQYTFFFFYIYHQKVVFEGCNRRDSSNVTEIAQQLT